MHTIKLQITNITCAACVRLASSALKYIPGVVEVMIDEKTGHTEISSEREIPWEDIASTLQSVGKEAILVT